ncbi:MAG TPA: OmpW family outer membrane protein [Thermoanaerobaculia bacterium]
MPDGTTITRSQTTTVVTKDGVVQNASNTGTSTVTDLANVPPGSVVTKTTTTITTKPGTVTAPQPVYVTTTPPNLYVNTPPPMTSSTTIYQPTPSIRGRRFPGFNFLVFADRASFSNSNSALSGTLNTGVLGSDISHENGYGLGFNTYLGRTNLSTEFTGSIIRSRATLTPANTQFNPITNFRFKMEPITGALQLHFNPRSSVDAYLGGGGAYVMFKPDNSFDAANTGLTGVHFRNEFGPLVNAGIGLGFSPNFGLNFDAKYMWVRAKATTTFNHVTVGNVGNSERIGVNPFIISAGLRFGF